MPGNCSISPSDLKRVERSTEKVAQRCQAILDKLAEIDACRVESDRRRFYSRYEEYERMFRESVKHANLIYFPIFPDECTFLFDEMHPSVSKRSIFKIIAYYEKKRKEGVSF